MYTRSDAPPDSAGLASSLTPRSAAAFGREQSPGGGGSSNATIKGHGTLTYPRWLQVLRLFTGWNGLAWIARTACGARTEARVRLHGQALVYEEAFFLFGSLSRQRVQIVPIRNAVVTLQHGRTAIAPTVGLLVAGLCTFVGAMWFIDAIRSGQLPLIFMALGIGLVGLSADVVLQQLARRRTPSASVEIAHFNFSVRIEGIDISDAEALLTRLPNQR